MAVIRRRLANKVIAVLAAVVLFGSVTVAMPTSNAGFNGQTSADAQFGSLDLDQLLGTSSWWLDSSDGSKLFSDTACSVPATGAGATVNCWLDSRDPNHKVISFSGTSYGTIDARTIGGRQTVHLGPAADMRGPDLFGGQLNNATIFIVANSLSATNNFLVNLNGNRTGSDRFSVHLPFSNNNAYFDAGTCCTVDRAYTTGVPLNADLLFVGWKDAAAGHSYHYIDRRDVKQSAGHTVATTSYGLRIGYLADHLFAEMIVFNRTLTPLERDGVANYLRLKWGLS